MAEKSQNLQDLFLNSVRKQKNSLTIFLVNGAPRVSIAQKRTNGTDWKTGYHRIRIERDTDAGTIKVYFNDMKVPVMETVDKTFLYGEVGLGSFDDTGNFDNFTLRGTEYKPAE